MLISNFFFFSIEVIAEKVSVKILSQSPEQFIERPLCISGWLYGQNIAQV